MKDSLKELIESGRPLKLVNPSDQMERKGREAFVKDLKEHSSLSSDDFEFKESPLGEAFEKEDGVLEIRHKGEIKKTVVEIKMRHKSFSDFNEWFIKKHKKENLLEAYEEGDFDYALYYNKLDDGTAIIWDLSELDFDKIREDDHWTTKEQATGDWREVDEDFFFLPDSMAHIIWNQNS